MAENLILPVPDMLQATYLVPTGGGSAAAKQHAIAALRTRVPDPVGTVARKMLEVGAVRVASVPGSAIPALPAELQEHLGIDRDALDFVSHASSFVSFSAAWPPGWPPVHEAAARGCAAALAADLGAPLVDTFVPIVLEADSAIAALPDAASQLKLSEWVLVLQSAASGGLWMTTKGMGRFGLPELQVLNVPPQLGSPWTSLLLGVCARLLDLWLNALRARDGAAFVEVPSVFEVGEADVADVYSADPQGGGRVLVRLSFDPAADDSADSFLTVQPPDDVPFSAGEYLAYASSEVLGDPGQEVRYLPQTSAMKQAIQAARSELPTVRSRFTDGDLPLGARLMVKHARETSDRTEYPWAYVNSWNDPATVLGSSASDGVHDAQVRAGRPIVVGADAIVDWAIWVEGRGIIEGGVTNAVALRQGRPAGQ